MNIVAKDFTSQR